MEHFGIDAKNFLNDYFYHNDARFTDFLDGILQECESTDEKFAVADLAFKNYIAEAFGEAMAANNEKIRSDVRKLAEELWGLKETAAAGSEKSK